MTVFTTPYKTSYSHFAHLGMVMVKILLLALLATLVGVHGNKIVGMSLVHDGDNIDTDHGNHVIDAMVNNYQANLIVIDVV